MDRPPSADVGGILAEEMGLGKTVEILSLLSLTTDDQNSWKQERLPAQPRRKPRGGTLIVCPVSLFGQWKTEIRSKLKDNDKFQSVSIYEYHNTRSIDPKLIAGHDIVLTAYSILNSEENGVAEHQKKPGCVDSTGSGKVSPLKQIEWYRVVLDECHVIKGGNTKQSLYCRSLETQRRWAVTGTVMQTKHADLGPVVNFLKHEPFGRSAKFSLVANQHNQHMPLLSVLMRDIVMRHMKTQIFEGEQILKLPDRSEGVRLLEMSSEEKKLYAELETKAKAAFDKIPAKEVMRNTLKIMSLLLPMRMLTSDPSALVEKSLQNIEKDEKDPNALKQDELEQKLKAGGVTDAARLKAIIESLDGSDDTNCSVCLDVVDAPSCTPCGHVFCSECIMGVLGQGANNSQGPCPECRTLVKEDALMKLKKEASAADSKIMSDLEKLQGMNGTKIKQLLKSLREMRRCDETAKAVVFSQFGATHLAVVKALEKAKIGVVQIRGNMTQKARANALEKFIKEDQKVVFALSMRSGACGLTLTAASRCYLMEPCFNEGTEMQAVNRIHRMGQTKPVRIVTFAMKGTVEERMLQLRRERSVDAASSLGDTSATAAAQPVGRGRGRGRGGGASNTNAMVGFQADREKLVAKTEEWQLLFGSRAATQQVDLGDPEPVAPPRGDDDEYEDQYEDGAAASAMDEDPAPAMDRPRRGKGPRKRYHEPGNDPEKDYQRARR